MYNIVQVLAKKLAYRMESPSHSRMGGRLHDENSLPVSFYSCLVNCNDPLTTSDEKRGSSDLRERKKIILGCQKCKGFCSLTLQRLEGNTNNLKLQRGMKEVKRVIRFLKLVSRILHVACESQAQSTCPPADRADVRHMHHRTFLPRHVSTFQPEGLKITPRLVLCHLARTWLVLPARETVKTHSLKGWTLFLVQCLS
ncbi:hypothetical protein MPTK1_6g06490 [Marchantia polymorpha subsp. ruderalis]|uniref:Uncharacterized protein n=2 Tax=Marchantia polymorpha TaxID=3197 RepID=A0AAF6BP67_MARPO|nr:hypothetical protein MARPO_0226s0006 [Marchantia polymorpha]BBN13801.1 hypothetical protein Mp_6g06490 [Marchantia polymorpha subsp. ruderalis]|eukprot:PTQ27077.1 hypothetical protein MARPO_0226s0006 [Marchantia polymorpha]